MVGSFLCSFSGADALLEKAGKRKKTASVAAVPSGGEKDKTDGLVVRYSTLDGEDNGIGKDVVKNLSSTESQTSRMRDDLRILRLKAGQTVTFHLKRRTNQIEKAELSAVEEQKARENNVNAPGEATPGATTRRRRQERERYVVLLRNRVMEVVKEIQRDVKKSNHPGSVKERIAKKTRKYQIRPHSVGPSLERIGTSIAFKDLTQQETAELKQILGDILRKKLRQDGCSGDGLAESRDCSKTEGVEVHNDISMTSSRRHKRHHRMPSASCTETGATAKVADSEGINERCLKILREKMRETTAKVVRSRHDDVTGRGDRDEVTKRKELNVFYKYQPPRPKLRLRALGPSSRDSTADWIMKQNFEQFDDCDVTNATEKRDGSESMTKAASA